MKNTLLHCVSSVRQTSFKFLTRSFALLMLLALGSSSLWAADGDTHDFAQTLSQQLNDNAPISSISIPQQEYAVKGIVVSYKTNKAASKVNIACSVGSDNWGNKDITSNTTTTMSFSGTAKKGAITLSFTNKSGTGSGKGTFTVTNVQLVEGGSAAKINVTLSRNGVTEIKSNQASPYTLPVAASEADACTDWKFKGWSTSPVTSTTTEPSYVTSVSTSTTVYAVYGKTESSGGATFTPGTTTSGSFTISSGEYYAKGTGSKINGVAASNADSYLFTQISGNQYSIKLGDNYITYASSTNLGTSTSSYSWTISAGTNGDWRIASGTTGRAFIFRAGSTNQFGGYSSSNVTATSTEYFDVSIGGGSTTTYTTSPECKTLSSIAVTTPPTKTTYTEGETFDPAGMVVTATYTDHTTAPITGYTYSPTGALAVGTTSITISYGGKTTTQPITVNAIPTRTINWLVNNSSVKSESKKEGVKLNTLTMPSTPADDALPCSDKFMGWSRSNLGAALGQDAPTDLFTDITKLPDTELVGSTNITFYAVFASTGGAGASSSITSFATGDYLLIDTYGDKYYAMSGAGTSSVLGVDITSAVTKNADGTISVNASKSVITDAMLYTIGGTASAATIYNIEDEKYIQGTTGTSFTTDATNTWEVTENNDRFTFEYSTRCILCQSGTTYKNYAQSNRGGSSYGTGYLYLAPATGYEDYVTSCGKSLSISPKSLTATRPNSGTGTLLATANLYTPSSYTWTTSDPSVATVSGSDATATVTYHASGSCTITCSAPDGSTPMTATATVTVPQGYYVEYIEGGSSTYVRDLIPGDKYTLPTNSTSCEGYTFLGWVTTPFTDGQSTKPASIQTGEKTMGSANVTYYAVYKFAEEGGETTFKVSTSLSDLVDGAKVGIRTSKGDKVALLTNGTAGVYTETMSTSTTGITLPANQIWTVTYNPDDPEGYEYGFYNAEGKYLSMTSYSAGGTLDFENEYEGWYPSVSSGKYTFEINDNVYLEYYNSVWQTYGSNSDYCKFWVLVEDNSGSFTYTNSPSCGPIIKAQGEPHITSAQSITIQAADSIQVKGTSLTGSTLSATSSNAHFTAELTNTSIVDGSILTQLVVKYTPVAAKTSETTTITIQDNTHSASQTITAHGYSLPNSFIIVTKNSKNQWVALPSDMPSASTYHGIPAVVNNETAPTSATKTADNTHYSLTTLRTTITSGETQSRYASAPWLVRLTTEDGKFLYGAKSNTNIYDGDASSTQSPYEWLLTTTNGIDYIIKNVSSNRTLAIVETDYIGQYNTGNDVFRIIPYVEDCKHFAAPTNVVASVIKATTAKILFDPVRNATHYEYKVNGASAWTSVDASTLEHSGTRIILPVTGLTRGVSNTVIIRGNDPTIDDADLCAPREEVSINFTTALCEHVAELGASSPAGTTANVQWKSDYSGLSYRAVLYSDRAGTHILQNNSTTETNYTFSGLEESQTYYYRIYSSEDGVDDGCPSKVDSFSTKSPDVEIMTWHTDGIDIAVNMEGNPVVLIANEQTHGTEGGGQKADEVFFSKYFEASSNVKLLALFNGTDHKVGLCDYTIKTSVNGKTATSGTHAWARTKAVDEFTVESGPTTSIPDSLEAGKELILISYSSSKGSIDVNDAKIIECAQDNPNSGFNNYYVVSDLKLDFNGNDAIGLWNTKTGTMIDLIGAGNSSGDDLTTFVSITKQTNGSGKVTSINSQSRTDIAVGDIVWMDEPGGWYSGFGTDTAGNGNYALSTNRCLLIRKNTVRAGYNSTNQGPNNAVDLNKTDFVTLGEHSGVPGEWFGVQIPNINPETGENDNGVGASCIGFDWVGSYDYSTYYKEFTTIIDSTSLDDVTLNQDGTYNIKIEGLDTLACTRLKLQMFSEKGATKPSVENIYKIPIMVSTSTTTNDELFTKLGEEVCKTCDLVVVENKQLTHTGATGAIDAFGSVKLYEGSQLTVSAGQTLTATSISLRSRQDEVASAYLPANNSVQAIDGEQPAVYFDKFISDADWHWITVPFDVNIASVTFTDHTSCVYGTDWFLKYYDGEARADNPKQADGRNWKLVDASTTLHPGVGYIVAINDQADGKWKELRFPMAGYDETGNKNVSTYAYGAGDGYADVTPNHKGWNLVGNPYISYYKNAHPGTPLQTGKLNPIDDGAGGTTYENSGDGLYYVTVPNAAGRAGYTQALISATQLPPFTSYFVQIAGTTKNEEKVVNFLAADRKTAASAPLRRNVAEEEEEIELPTFVGVNLTNSLGEVDNTGLCIMDAYTQSTYEVGADLGKWIGSKYSSYTQPILYSTAHSDKLAFNALSEEEAKQNMAVSLGCVLLQSGTYTFSLNRDYDLSRVESVFLYDALTNTNTDLTKSDYTFSGSAANKEINDRFYLSAVLREKVDVVTGLGMKTFGDDAIIKFITPDGQLHVARKGVVYDAQGRIERVIR